jgi:hypothetical protein
MGFSLAAFIGFSLAGTFDARDPREAAMLMLAVTAISTLGWVVVTFVTRPTDDEKLRSFYMRVRPGGPGWWPVQRALGLAQEPIADGALSWVNWVAGIVSVYSTLFGMGRVIFGDLWIGLAWLAVAAVAFTVIGMNLRTSSVAAANARTTGERGGP